MVISKEDRMITLRVIVNSAKELLTEKHVPQHAIEGRVSLLTRGITWTLEVHPAEKKSSLVRDARAVLTKLQARLPQPRGKKPLPVEQEVISFDAPETIILPSQNAA